MAKRVVILGAGFGGLELSTILSDELGEDADVTLIDKGDAFVFGYSKLDLMFGRKTPEAVRLPYSDFAKPGVRLIHETITAIDPEGRRVSTDGGEYEADILVVALGADYDLEATPGLAEGGNEFYSVAGAERLRDLIPGFTEGRAVVGVCGAPFKCPPAPSEAALLLHDHLSERGARDACEITLLMPLPSPVPGGQKKTRLKILPASPWKRTYLLSPKYVSFWMEKSSFLYPNQRTFSSSRGALPNANWPGSAHAAAFK